MSVGGQIGGDICLQYVCLPVCGPHPEDGGVVFKPAESRRPDHHSASPSPTTSYFLFRGSLSLSWRIRDVIHDAWVLSLQFFFCCYLIDRRDAVIIRKFVKPEYRML